MFRSAKIVASLKSDWDYTVTVDDSRNLDSLLQLHGKIRRLPPTAAAGMFLCHMMKRDYEFASLYFPDVLIKILNLPDQHPDKLARQDADTLLDRGGVVGIGASGLLGMLGRTISTVGSLFRVVQEATSPKT